MTPHSGAAAWTPAQRRHFRAGISAPYLIKGLHRLGGGRKGVQSPLLPGLTLLQSGRHPSHSQGHLSLLLCPQCTHPGGPASCRGQAIPLFFLEGEQAAKWRSRLEQSGSQLFLYLCWCQFTPSPCPPEGGRKQCDWSYCRLGKAG